MLIVQLKGGLGNQLFQYAFGRRLAIIRNEEFLLDSEGLKNDLVTNRHFSLEPFKIKGDLAEEAKIIEIKYPLGLITKIIKIFQQKILRQFNIGWQPGLLKSRKKYFEGFFQSYKYLEPIREQLLDEISLKESLEGKYSDLLDKINTSNSVSIHIRRGDYISNLKTKAAHYTYGLEYYEEALKLIEKQISNPVYFIFSDDINWAKENLKINSSVIFVSSLDTNDYEELILMSKCKNNIIANSSFSFWAAWLNQNPDKIVIAPKKWNNVYSREYIDLLPDNWLKI